MALCLLTVSGVVTAGVAPTRGSTSSTTACTPSGDGDLSVTVLDRNSDPIWGASVILYDENWNTVTKVSTDSGGVADLGTQPQDEYNVEAYLSGEFLGGINICHDASSSSPTLRRDSPYATSVAITDEGDGDGVHEQGETLTISPSVYNAEDYALDLKTRIIVEGDGVERVQNGVESGDTAWFGRDFTPSAGGTYSVTVEVYAEYSAWQLTDTVTTSFEVNRAPEASVSSPDPSVTVRAGSAQTFTARGTDPDDNLRGVEWYLDGNYRTVTDLSGGWDTASWTHTFDSPGTYTIEGLVFDEQYRYDTDAATWTVEVCAPRIETSPSDVDMGQFSAEDRETVRIDIVNAGCGDLDWDVSSAGLFTVVDRGSDYLVVRTSDGVYGDFDSYVEVVALNEVVEADGFARTQISGTAAIEAEPPTAEYISPTGTSSYVGRDVELQGGASPGSDGLPEDQFPAASADELVFVWEIDGTEVARSKSDGSGGVPAVDTINHEFTTTGDHTVTLTVEDPVSGKSDTISEQGFTIEPVTVSGTVTHAQLDVPLGGVTVDLGGRSTTTSSSGQYSFEVSEAGMYTLSIDEAGYEPVSRQLDIDAPSGGTVTADVDLAGEPVDVAFTVQKKGSIEAYDWFGGEPLPDANVTFDGQTRGVDEEGRVVFEAVEPGVHIWNITAPGWGWNNGSRAIYGSERNLEISAGVAPSGSGVLEIHPMNGSEEVAITKFDVYVDDRLMEPNVENNRLVLVEGTHVLELVPTATDESLRTVRTEVVIERDMRTVTEVNVGLREDVVLDEMEVVAGATRNGTRVGDIGWASTENSTTTFPDRDTATLYLRSDAFGTGATIDPGGAPSLVEPAANASASGLVTMSANWTAPSDEVIVIRDQYTLSGYARSRLAKNQNPLSLFAYSVAGGGVWTKLVVFDATDDEVVKVIRNPHAQVASPSNLEEFLGDMFMKAVDGVIAVILSKLKVAEAMVGVLGAQFPSLSPAVLAGVVSVGEEVGSTVLSEGLQNGLSNVVETGDDERYEFDDGETHTITTALEVEEGHKYVITHVTQGYTLAGAVGIGGRSVSDVNVVTEVDRFVIERNRDDMPSDTTPPRISVLSAPAQVSQGGTASMTLGLSDNAAPASELEYSYRIIEGGQASEWSGWSSAGTDGEVTEQFDFTSEGAHTVEFRARDPTGNVRYGMARISVTVDTTPPSITEFTARNISTAGATLAITRVEENTLLDRFELQYRAEGDTAWSDLATLRRANATRLQRGGTYEVRARAVDAAGNVGSWTKLTLTVPGSNVAPEVKPRVSDQVVDVGDRVTLYAELSDEDDGTDGLDVTWSQRSGPVSVTVPDGMSPEVTLPEPGSYTFEITVVDDDGASDSATVTVDVREPTTVTTSATPTEEPPTETTSTRATTAVPERSTTPGTAPGDGDAGDLVTEAEEQAETLQEKGEELLTEAPGQPGFGPVSLVIALLALIVLARRRQEP